MKKLILIIAILFSVVLFANEKKVEQSNKKEKNNLSQFKGLSDDNTGRIGVGLGGYNHVSGITGKYYLTDKIAAQAVLGFMYYGGFSFGVDGLYEFLNILKENKDILLPVYAGAGLGGWFWDGYSVFSASAIVGIGLQFRTFPIEITAEIRPSFFFGDGWGSGNSNFYFQGGGSVRFFF